MNKTIIKAPCINMQKMESLFIEMTAKNCNLQCKYCYIDFKDKKVKDFIPIDKIKQALSQINKKELKFIHLTGAEPMLHNDFNHILRLCLKYSSVVIHTNALNINDKKARFLRKVEEENNLGNEIIFMISIDHYIEKENDLLRGRGSYRKAIHAIQSLTKYGFNPILSIVNHNNTDEKELKENFRKLCQSINFETSDINFKIIPLIEKNKTYEIDNETDFDKLKVECAKSRTLSINGIFTCPLLCGDNRGKCGSDFNDFSRRSYLETPYCSQCIKYNSTLFSLDL
ncbi:TPA: radical SAM protein [Candidatus Avigastranaerophilus faecigallinarum]|nr:radical SAM protein [Candidatus Avigastranaerophilus faecigallinarum]